MEDSHSKGRLPYVAGLVLFVVFMAGLAWLLSRPGPGLDERISGLLAEADRLAARGRYLAPKPAAFDKLSRVQEIDPYHPGVVERYGSWGRVPVVREEFERRVSEAVRAYRDGEPEVAAIALEAARRISPFDGALRLFEERLKNGTAKTPDKEDEGGEK